MKEVKVIRLAHGSLQLAASEWGDIDIEIRDYPRYLACTLSGQDQEIFLDFMLPSLLKFLKRKEKNWQETIQNNKERLARKTKMVKVYVLEDWHSSYLPPVEAAEKILEQEKKLNSLQEKIKVLNQLMRGGEIEI